MTTITLLTGLGANASDADSLMVMRGFLRMKQELNMAFRLVMQVGLKTNLLWLEVVTFL